MNKKHLLEQGFTLIEIIIVLVLLGILAATAVPKYFDLQATAQARAAQSVVAEVQARINMDFANRLLQGDICSVALTHATTLTNIQDGETANVYGGWTLPITIADGVASVTAEGVKSPTGQSVDTSKLAASVWKFNVPKCD